MKSIDKRLEQLERGRKEKDVYHVVMPGDPTPDLPSNAHGIVVSFLGHGELLPGIPAGITQITFDRADADL